jgi:hypothetical protein
MLKYKKGLLPERNRTGRGNMPGQQGRACRKEGKKKE